MLFNSFETLLAELPRLADQVPDVSRYWGHTPGAQAAPEKLPELLQEHIDRVNATCLGLVRAHGLEPVVDGLISALLPAVKVDNSTTTWAGNFIKTGFLAAVAFHDFGKLNENYQAHLGNGQFSKPVANNIGSEHSGLGAFLWLHYALHQLDSANLHEVVLEKLIALTLDFADLILNHHSSKLFRREFIADKYSRLHPYLAQLQLPAVADALQVALEKEGYHQDFYQHKNGSAAANGFSRFALLKLCFSLLTASDYLATLGYMQTGGDYTRLDAPTLGILSAADKAAFYARFCSFKYNQAALADPDAYADLPWEAVAERNGPNLDQLRQKLLAEVVRSVRRQPAAPLYYLEAPTGAGKTNLSLAVALELLNHDDRLGKVFYVFPFTTLITQTYDDIRVKLGLTDAQIVQLHSKAEYATRPTIGGETEGAYGPLWHNHVDNLFVQYPIVLLSHVRFFDVLKSNRKEANYLLHRLANSVVVLDEVQSYSPTLWDHVNYFLLHYARLFNIRVVVMSATLPKLYQLTREADVPAVVPLVAAPARYFQNANFAGRVRFDFELTRFEPPTKSWRERYGARPENAEERRAVLGELADAVAGRCEAFAAANGGQVAGIVEFITKKSAAGFVQAARGHPQLREYEIRVLSGTILEPRRREVVRWLKAETTRRAHPRLLLVCTQVVEAGVDIDMDVGFKDRSLLDSDEQLAGRVNRNARRPTAPVYLFDLDSEAAIYGADLRLRVARKLPPPDYERILREKDFDYLYQQVIAELNGKEGKLTDSFGSYQELIRLLEYADIDRQFQLIEDDTESVFIPLNLSATAHFSDAELLLLRECAVHEPGNENVEGEHVFRWYIETIKNKSGDFIRDRDARQRLQSIMSKFTISVYPQLAQQMRGTMPEHDWHEYGFVYLHEPERYYSYEEGLLPTANFALGDFW